ncbi:SMC family ATPase [Pyrobaculum sp. 3827-6]|uniref:AAA family ATPase n=1 Tax=Pyrobaculum sp. 3827-6 TaxID=2983604 RepID=UPI0021D9C928|nr:SMC family ATPase [Pyrobaculum sp. 3827-6]MCU7786568.1 SMC family ATPase [Pyrobaculum sp. 3827-6]
MWRIEKIELENFRSYRGRHVIAFGDVNILWGRIGAGKTSVLYAIEYALFGRQLEVKERVARLVDLINTEAHEMSVALTMRGGDRVLRVERRLGRRGAERLLLYVDGVELRGREAEERLAELVGADEDVYERLVYMSHRSLEGFIYGTSQKRSIAIDRLFGIDVVDGVVRAISGVDKVLMEKAEELRRRLKAYEKYREVIRRYGGIANVKSRLEGLAGEVEALKSREEALSKAAEELARRRAEHLTKLRENEALLLEYYKTKSELEVLEEAAAGGEVDITAVDRLRGALREAVEEFEHMLGGDLAERLEKAGDLEALSAAMAEAYDALVKLQRELEGQIQEARRLYEQYLARAKKLEGEEAEAGAKLKRLERSYQRFKELQKAFQSLEEARSALAEHRRRLEEVERAVAFSSALRTVAMYAAEADLKKCPVCGGPLKRDDALRVAEEVEARHGSLIKEAEALREKMRELERAVEEMEALSGDVAEYMATKTKLEELRLEREEVVKRALQAEKSVKQLEKKLDRLRELLTRVDRRTISEALSKYGRALRARELRRRLRELEDALRRGGVSGEVLDLDMRWREVAEELERVSAKLSEAYRERGMLEEVVREVGEDADVLKKRLDDVLYAYGRLQDFKARLELVKVNARARLLEVAKTRFNEVFTSLYKYGDIVRVDADLEQRKGYYDFVAVTPSGDRYGISKLSDGQRLSIALALALALRDISKINLGFIIFDEPIPYVDVNIRKAFVDLVEELAKKFQIVIATQSREFAEIVKAAVPRCNLFAIEKGESSVARLVSELPQ